MSYSVQPLKGLLDLFATGEPVPGGGPAAALAAALGTSLVTMAATLAKAKSSTPGEASDLAGALARLRSLRIRLLALADDDSVAYASVLAAYRLPKATAGEKEARTAAIQVAMQAAADVPLDMMRACEHVLREAVWVTERVPASAKIDLAIGIEMVDASRRGCSMCVEANAGVLTAAAVRRRFNDERLRIDGEAAAHLERSRERAAVL